MLSASQNLIISIAKGVKIKTPLKFINVIKKRNPELFMQLLINLRYVRVQLIGNLSALSKNSRIWYFFITSALIKMLR